MKLSFPKLTYQANITQIGSSLKLLLKRHWLSLSITSILSGMLLTLPTIFFLFNLQIHQFINQSNEQQQITVFLPPNSTESQINATLQKIRAMPNLKQATLVNNDAALKSIQYIEGINAAIKALGGVNPLHHTILITPDKMLSKADIQITKATLNTLPNISHVAIDEQWIIFIHKITNRLANFLTLFAFLSALITSTLIFYFMLVRCMTTHAEMKLKFYLGAYPWQIYQPYIGFGLVIGALSGAIAVFLSSLSYYSYTAIWQNTMVQELIQQPLMTAKPLFYLFIISLLISLLSSAIATFIVRKNILKDYLPIQ